MTFIFDIMLLPAAIVLSIFFEANSILKTKDPVSVEAPVQSVRGEALASTASRSAGVVVAGLDGRIVERLVFKPVDIRDKALAALAHADSVLINQKAAEQLEIRRGELLTLLLPAGSPTPMGAMPKRKSYRVAAVITQMNVDDVTPVIYLDDAEARELFGVTIRRGVIGTAAPLSSAAPPEPDP